MSGSERTCHYSDADLKKSGPQVGWFISEYPIKLSGDTNFYAFAHNDPINGNDPNGLCDAGDILQADSSDLNFRVGVILLTSWVSWTGDTNSITRSPTSAGLSSAAVTSRRCGRSRPAASRRSESRSG